jgi:hypothetical protein
LVRSRPVWSRQGLHPDSKREALCAAWPQRDNPKMEGQPEDSDAGLQQQIDALSGRVDANRAGIDALQTGATTAQERAEASEARAGSDSARIDELETRADIDERMIMALQADGLLNRDLIDQMYEALRASRKIGAAIGIIMAEQKVCEEDAFAILARASQNGKRKVRELADEVVQKVNAGGATEP